MSAIVLACGLVALAPSPLLRPPVASARAAVHACDGDDLVAQQQKEIERLRTKMAGLQNALKAKLEEEEETRRATIREAAGVLAEAELADLLVGQWAQGAPHANQQALRSDVAEEGAEKVGKVVPASDEARAAATVAAADASASDASAAAALAATSLGDATFDDWLAAQSRSRKSEAAFAAARAAIASAVSAEAAAASQPPPVSGSDGAGKSGSKGGVRYTVYGRVPREFDSQQVEELLAKRGSARLKRHYSEADRLQKKIIRLGVQIDDRRRTWSVVKGWKRLQQQEAKKLASATDLATAIRGSDDPELVGISAELDRLVLSCTPDEPRNEMGSPQHTAAEQAAAVGAAAAAAAEVLGAAAAVDGAGGLSVHKTG